MPTLEQKLEATQKKLDELKKKKQAIEKAEAQAKRKKKRKAEARAAIILMAMLRKAAEQDQGVAAALQRAVEAVSRRADVKTLQDAGWLQEIEETESEDEDASATDAQATATGPSPERLAELAAIRAGWGADAEDAFEKLRAALTDERRGYAGYLLAGYGEKGLNRTGAQILVDQLTEIGEGHPEAFMLLEKALQDLRP